MDEVKINGYIKSHLMALRRQEIAYKRPFEKLGLESLSQEKLKEKLRELEKERREKSCEIHGVWGKISREELGFSYRSEVK